MLVYNYVYYLADVVVCEYVYMYMVLKLLDSERIQ